VNLDRVFNILGSIVTVAMVTVIVSSPNTSKIIREFGSSFSGAVRSAMGKK
jgi:hypothetical protein